MKTKVAAIYGKRDVRLREFELPEITDICLERDDDRWYHATFFAISRDG